MCLYQFNFASPEPTIYCPDAIYSGQLSQGSRVINRKHHTLNDGKIAMPIFYWQGSADRNRYTDVARVEFGTQPQHFDWRNDWRVEFALLVAKAVTAITVVCLAAVIAVVPYSVLIKLYHPGRSVAVQRHRTAVNTSRPVGNTDSVRKTNS